MPFINMVCSKSYGCNDDLHFNLLFKTEEDDKLVTCLNVLGKSEKCTGWVKKLFSEDTDYENV